MAKKAASDVKRKSQVAALPLKTVGDDTRVLLVTSRETRRWIIPKGWPEKGMKDCQAAAREALEEAGLIGTVARKPLGSYDYFKRLNDRFEPCTVDVFRLDVEDQRLDWIEKNQRKQAWFSLRDAAELVDEPELAQLILGLADTKAAAE